MMARESSQLAATKIAGERAVDVVVDVDAGAEGARQPRGADRILANLVTNALRYGEAPVRVRRAGGASPSHDGRGRERLLPRPLPAAALRALQPCASPSSGRTARGSRPGDRRVRGRARGPHRVRAAAGHGACFHVVLAAPRAQRADAAVSSGSRVDHASMGGVNRRRRGQGRRARKVAVLCVGLAAGAAPRSESAVAVRRAHAPGHSHGRRRRRRPERGWRGGGARSEARRTARPAGRRPRAGADREGAAGGEPPPRRSRSASTAPTRPAA
jgi:hypothetical protein